jgi:PAS domain S-box-containing protein
MISSLYMLAGICVCAAFNHLSIGLYRPYNRPQLLFAGLCLLMVPFALMQAQTLQATNVTEFIRSLKWNITTISLFFALFSWFIAQYTENRLHIFPAGLSMLVALLIVANLTQPYSLQYDQFDSIRILHLPWGEEVARGVGHNGTWFYIGIAGAFVTFGYALYALGSAYRRHRRNSDLGMMLAVLLFLFIAIEGILARLSVIDFIELGPFGFQAMVIVMSVVLSYDTQHRLRISERQFRELFENSPTGMVAIDPDDGRIVQANRIALNMTGYSAVEILTKSVADIISPEDREDARQRYEQLAKGLADHMNYERRFLRKDGNSILAEIFISTLKDDQDKVVQFIASATDITERKLTEDALAAREAQMNTLIESVPDSIQFKDGEGRWLIANEVCLRLFGLKGVNWRNLTDKDIGVLYPRLSTAMAACKNGDENAWESAGMFHDEEIVVDPQGKNIHFDVVKVPLFDDRNQRKALIIIGRDITERKQIEKSLKESETRFRSIVEQSPIAISFSRDGYLVDANAAHKEMFRYADIEEVIGKPVINQVALQCRAEMEDRIKRRFQGELAELTIYETTGLRKDGSQFPMLVSAKRMVLSDGPMSTAFLIDFTERDQMRQSIERISKLYKMLSDINSANIHIRERGKLFETACRIAVESGLFCMTWIGLLDRQNGDVERVAQAGHVEGYFDGLKINIFDAIMGSEPTGMAIKSGLYAVCNNIDSDPHMAPWREEALKLGYRASIVFPLTQSDQVVGSFSLYCDKVGSLTDDVIQLLGNLVEDISFALDFIDESSRREQVQNELRELTIFQQSALESERKRIARELHDELGQTMTALHFDLKWLHEHIDDQENELQNRLHSMQSLLGRTVDTVRRISEDLRPGMLDDLGLAAAIEHHVEKFAEQTGIACNLGTNQAEFDLDEQAATTMFRIVQESLTNVARHSGASSVNIDLRELGDNILLIVQDNGRGLPSSQETGRKTYGLLGMRERVKMLGGALDIFNEAGAGVRIEVCIPKYTMRQAQQ